MKESGRHEIYIRNFIKRHPDIILKSYASLEAKINYITRTLNRQLNAERTFPLILHYSYNKVIRPRGDLLKDRVGYFDLKEAFCHSDEAFCKHWGIDLSELKDAKAKRHRTNDDEKDILWKYVHSREHLR